MLRRPVSDRSKEDYRRLSFIREPYFAAYAQAQVGKREDLTQTDQKM